MKKLFIRIAVTLVVVILILWFGGKFFLSYSLPQYDGEIALSSINDTVEITFDKNGIPQIWAKTDDDIYFALGWLHASERLFQMELVRRLSKGELAELFGKDALEIDIFQRKIGFFRKAKSDLDSVSSRNLKILTQYCNGINEWVDHIPVLPPEFVILGFEPKEWKPEDCLTIFYYQTWYSHDLIRKDDEYNFLMNKFGESFENVLTQYIYWSPPTIHPGKKILRENISQLMRGLNMSSASNSWAVAPEKSASGKVIHASDPHLAVNMFPGFWYIAGLHSKEGTNVLGISAAGLPLITMGHTDKIAYAFTVAAVDLIDYYVEQKNPGDTLQVLTPSGYKKLNEVSEEILIDGEKQPRKFTFYYSDNGPVVESDSLTYTTLKWAGFDFDVGLCFNTAIKLHTAENFDEFRKCVTGIGALDANWTYSDIQGNIGYQLGAPLPIRNFQNSFVHAKAEDSTYRWRGYQSLEKTPYLYNPEEGWLATCNNQVVNDSFGYKIPGFYDPYRIIRISELLQQQKKFTSQDFEKFQMDNISMSALQWKDLLISGAEKLNDKNLFARLNNWNGEMVENSWEAAIYSYWFQFLPEFLFKDDLFEDYPASSAALHKFLTNPIDSLFDNIVTKEKIESLSDISAESLSKAISLVNGRTYGEVSKIKISHPLGIVGILDFYLNLNRGPFPAEGNNGTLNANFTKYDTLTKTFKSIVGPSMRYVLDWNNIDEFSININTGQSGNPLSDHYDDFVEIMRNGDRWVVPFTKDKVYQKMSSLLILKNK